MSNIFVDTVRCPSGFLNFSSSDSFPRFNRRSKLLSIVDWVFGVNII